MSELISQSGAACHSVFLQQAPVGLHHTVLHKHDKVGRNIFKSSHKMWKKGKTRSYNPQMNALYGGNPEAAPSASQKPTTAVMVVNIVFHWAHPRRSDTDPLIPKTGASEFLLSFESALDGESDFWCSTCQIKQNATLVAPLWSRRTCSVSYSEVFMASMIVIHTLEGFGAH